MKEKTINKKTTEEEDMWAKSSNILKSKPEVKKEKL